MEGPTVIKKDELYYLFYSANHFRSIDYAVGYATATSPMGPWTKHAGNPIIHRSIVGENGSGHGDLFFDQHDNAYYVYHVHQSGTKVAPRKTRIVPLTFSFNSSTGKYDISANVNEVIIPKVRATSQAQYKTIESNLTGTQKAVAFCFNNNETGLFELPELPHAREMTLHIRNGNQTSPTELALEKYENGNWQWLHTFNLQNWGAFPNFRDEVLHYDINSTTPVKLRLINNIADTKRYINLQNSSKKLYNKGKKNQGR
jgi:beta-xylosidase